MEVRTIHYPLWHTSVQISAFIPRQGVAEYMAMVIPEPGVGILPYNWSISGRR